MAKIHELSDLLANQIAAGEVIERPASVVKELVENAIDANAQQIDVVVDNAGLDLIKVIDNGEGIANEDVPLAFVRHATSKIENRHDLFKVMTLGFRGEALPSIASVADVTLQTRTATSENGMTYQVKGGQVVQESPAAGRYGTIVSVRNLFYNTPARLKYLKKPQTELSLMTDVMNHLALAHPERALTLTHNGKVLVKTAGNGDLRQVLAAIYDRKTAEKMVAFSGQSEHFKVSGYLTLPEQTRASRSYLAVLVNNRFVKNFSVSNAIIKGYGSKLMVGRFPIGAVSIELDPLMVDVNVHPQKAEIRLSEQGELTDLLTEVIAERLAQENLIPDALENLGKEEVEVNHPGLVAPKKPATVEVQTAKSTGGELLNSAQRSVKLTTLPAITVRKNAVIQLTDKAYLHDAAVVSFMSRYQSEAYVEPFGQKTRSVVDDAKMADPLEKRVAEPIADYQNQDFSQHLTMTDQPTAAVSKQAKVQNVDLDVDVQDATDNPQGFPNLDYIGQMHGTFLFAQDKDKFYLIDQHAAQERLNYEFYRKQVGDVSDNRQVLLQPLTLTYSTADILKIMDHRDVLAQVGLSVEEFGPNTLALYEHPTWMKADQVEDTVREMIDWVLSGEELTVAAFREKAAIMMSCKRAIKANWHLSPDEARRLLVDLAKAKNPYNCPHGRPVLTAFTLTEMERMFKRIQDSHESWQNYDRHPF